MSFLKKYEKAVREHFGSNGVGEYDPAPEKVLSVIRGSLDHPIRINDVVWHCLAKSDPRISRNVCSRVYNNRSWEVDEDTRKLKLVFESLLLPTGAIDWDKYL